VDTLSPETLIDLAYALGIGLFIGLEREHSEVAEGISPVDSPEEHDVEDEGPESGVVMGLRTFALLSLLGWVTGVAGATWPWLPPVGLVVVGGLVTAQYFVAREQGVGLTTEAAAVLTFLLGLMVTEYRSLAVALALVTTLLLISKHWMRGVVGKVRRVELTGALQLLILLAIVLPLLPAEPLDPWDALPPRKIGLFVVLIAGMSYVGYLLTRILGHRRGVGLTGLFGGLTSSTAVTVSMAKVGCQEYMRIPGQMATFIANAVMFARVITITAVVSSSVAWRVALPMAAMGAVMLGAAAWIWRRMDGHADADETARAAKLENPFALIPALKWGVVLCGVLLVAFFARDAFGDRGLFAAAAISGLADVDAITLAASEQSSAGTLAYGSAATAVTIAVMSNTVVKAGMAYFGGGAKYGKPIVAVFAGAIAVGGIAILVA
jgi:uncharacterized membrane protein (DUF4010 family)